MNAAPDHISMLRIGYTKWLLVCLLLTGVTGTTATAQSRSAAGFQIRSYGGKCLDFGVPPQISGAPVVIQDCNGTTAQQIGVEEVNSRHEVILRAGSKVIGVRQPPEIDPSPDALPDRAAQSDAEDPLEVQDEEDRNTVLSRGQIFRLDGDSIMLAANHDFVVEVQNNRGTNGTPLVLGRRDLADAEFWDFRANDGSGRPPTSGFVSVTSAEELLAQLDAAQDGTVIEIHPDAAIDLSGEPALRIRTGVTVRGDRRGWRPGPEVFTTNAANGTMLEVKDPELGVHDVRISGLRLRGPTRSTNPSGPPGRGILVTDNFFTHSILIDHNDASNWPIAAIDVAGEDLSISCQAGDEQPPTRPASARVARNFLHHNQRQEKGYGVVTSKGGYASIEGNTFVSNRHAIASSGEARTNYLARQNLVLSAAPWQYLFPGTRFAIPLWHTQDFDVHGTGGNGFGGTAGQYFEIAGNTFLARNRENLDLRGTPCSGVEFRSNISRRHLTPVSSSDLLYPAVTNHGDSSGLLVVDNVFGAGDATSRLGVGDFDGDGLEDLFLATGAAWYYAPAGKAEWRFVNAQTDAITGLLFGDFDADGRTDVLAQHGQNWDVSWGGASRWETINASVEPFSQFAVGDFVGDARADVFYGDGETWWISDGGVGEFTALDASSFRVANLRFGRFDEDAKTDVFGVVSGQWMVAYGGTSGWQRLRSRLTNSVAGLFVADFDGDGIADVATSTALFQGYWLWRISYSGTGGWTSVRVARQPLSSAAAIGRFDDDAAADALLWNGNSLDIVSGATGGATRQSRQDMR